jgi:hypothetical protein
MTKHLKTWLAVVGAAALLGALVGGASARTLSVSNQTTRATWSVIEFISASGVTVRCPLTLEGSFHSRTLAKVVGSLVGYTTRAAFPGDCPMSVRPETLPWHEHYLGFIGTLPNVTEVRTNDANIGFNVTAIIFGFPVTCSYRTGTVRATFNRETGGALTSERIEASGLPPDEGFPCGEGELRGTSNTLTVLNSSTRLTIRLI